MVRLSIPTIAVCTVVAIVGACDPSAACNPAPTANLLEEPIVGDLREGMEQGEADFDHGTYDELLADHVVEEAGNVDYAALAEEEDRLDAYLDRIAEADLASLPRDEQLALLLNAYNAATLKLILEYYPALDSIRDIPDPWSRERWEVGGHELSLDEIEHNLVRPLYKDPRIHFAVNCAAEDCPYLADDAYTGEDIDEQLEARTEATLANEQFVRIQEGELRYTRVMHWYRSDFVDPAFRGHAPNVAQYIARYATDEVRRFIEEHDGEPPMAPLQYDWALNEVEPD